MTSLDFDVFDPLQTHDMWDRMRAFRKVGAVVPIQGDFVYVSRYDEVREILRDEETYSNVGGMRPTGLEIPLHDASIGELGPPVHVPARRLATIAAQGGGVLKRARPVVRELTQELIEPVVARGLGDLIAEYALPLTARVIGWLLEVPKVDCDRLAAWGEEIMSSPLTVTNRTERGEGYAGAFPEFTRYLEGLVEARVGEGRGGEDTISRILAAPVEGIEQTVPNVRMVLLNLVLGGTATTRDLIGNLLLEVLSSPGLHRKLHEERALIPRAVEESLRLAPPVLYVIRTCTRDVELGGVSLTSGQRVVVGIASANRDERVYPDAERFLLERSDSAPHLSFGLGQHFCVGAPLARLEAEVALDRFLEHFAPGSVRLSPGFEREWMPLPYMLGPVRIDVEAVGHSRSSGQSG